MILRIEHKVPDFETWKKAFDSDPIDRKRSGVRRYCILRPTDDQNYVIVDLQFENTTDAEAALKSLRKLWSRVEGQVMFDPQTRILNEAEVKQY